MIQINAVIDSKTQEFLQVKSETGSSMQMVRRDEKKRGIPLQIGTWKF